VRNFLVAGLLVRGLGVDPATGEVWVTSDADRNLRIYGPTGDLRRTLLVDNRGWGVAVAGDVVYVADAAASRIIVFDRVSGARLGVVGTAGNALGQVNGPSGLTVGPDGRLVVVEQRNARVQMFGPGPVPAADGVAPAVTWTGPANGSTSAAWPVTVTGRATDPTGVAQVQVAVRSVATGQLWDGTNTRWGPWVWNQAVTTGAVEDAAWSFTLMPAVPGTTYQFTVRAIDRRGAVSASLTRTFTFADVATPAVAITGPAAGTSLPRGASVVSGTVADDLGPTAVAVAVEDPAAGRWWDPATGTWGMQAAYTPADAPDTPGALTPRQVGAWSWPVDTSSWATASVVVHARATDAAGRATTTTAALGVATADTTPPATAITSPAVWSNPVGVPLAGTARDNLAVASVGVAVQNLDTLQWWDQSTGTWVPSLRWNPATMAGAGGPNATWSYPLSLPAGRWHLQARAVDAAGLTDPTTARYSFRVG
jgi:Bacterial Ig domain